MSTRCRSGVKELDNILSGGYPRGSLILIAGNPGAGKTILASQFTYDGLKNNEKVVYASFAEPRKDYLKNMQELGMNFQAYEDQGFKLMVFPTMEKKGMSDAIGQILKNCIEFKAQRLVIDSLSAILQTTNTEEIRVFVHTIFSRLVKTLGMTVLLLSEIPFGTSKIGAGIEEFVADGIIILKTYLEGIAEKRILTIAKMRGTSIARASFEYLIDAKYNGISLVTLPIRASILTAPTEKIGSGIDGLDKLLFGGFLRNSITLIVGEAGIGKTTFTLHSALANAKAGGKVLFLTWEETIGQIKRMMTNFKMDIIAYDDRFIIDAYVPEALTPLHYFKLLKDLFEQYKPTFIVFDSISSISQTLPPEDYLTFLRNLELLCKERGVTAMLTSTMNRQQQSQIDLSILADNIITMRYSEQNHDILREMLIVKTRSAAHEKKIISFDITDKGFVLKPEIKAGEPD